MKSLSCEFTYKNWYSVSYPLGSGSKRNVCKSLVQKSLWTNCWHCESPGVLIVDWTVFSFQLEFRLHSSLYNLALFCSHFSGLEQLPVDNVIILLISTSLNIGLVHYIQYHLYVGILESVISHKMVTEVNEMLTVYCFSCSKGAEINSAVQGS